jgi:hypothetical protein
MLGFNEQPVRCYVRTFHRLHLLQLWTRYYIDPLIRFPGILYAPLEDNFEMLVIYDVKGFIAGMHSVVPKDVTEDDKYVPYSTSIWYRLTRILDQDVYLTTAYFVDVDVICVGRSQEDFANQGTGYTLLFQNGNKTTDIIAAPLKV